MPLTSRLAFLALFPVCFADDGEWMGLNGLLLGRPVVFKWAKAGVGSRHVTRGVPICPSMYLPLSCVVGV